jgi:hypothetical protein
LLILVVSSNSCCQITVHKTEVSVRALWRKKPSPLVACSQLHASGLWSLFLGRALSALRSIGFTQSTCGWA